ncbi:hypothetical protein EXS73_02130 [Candidatus Pacearchaeota archaeon]|nr:hypothetical protein [Candidatus Pacearchaeota archaeon]
MPRKKMVDVSPAMQELLVKNLIELQKVHTQVIERFDKVSHQLSDLLALFEATARTFAEHPSNQGLDKDKEFLEKIDLLLGQNKTIAKGLTLMEDHIRERVYGKQPEEATETSNAPIASRPLPRF